MKYEFTGWFQYQDPHEPVGFEFDEETIKRLGDPHLWSLSCVIDRIDPEATDDLIPKARRKKFKITLEEIQ